MTDQTTGSNGAGNGGPTGAVQEPPRIPYWGMDLPAIASHQPLVDAVPEQMGRRLLWAAGVIGAAFQLLFVGQGIGINAVLWTALLLVAAGVARRRGTPFDPADAWLALAALAAAGLLAVRADPVLVVFDSIAMLVLTGASVAALSGISVTRRSVGGLLALLVRGGVVALSGATALGPGARAVARDAHGLPGGRLRRIAVGLAIAAPMLGVFAALFASADAVFGRALADTFEWRVNLGSIPLRITVAVLAAWVGAGMLVLVVAAARRMHDDEPVVPPASLGGLEASVALFALDGLFAAFVLFEATYLFGGRDTLAASGLTYSDYARRGFFELVTVAGLVGALVCVLEAVVRDRSGSYRAASLLLVALTAVVLVSAAFRLGLYQQAYGWTELRFYVLAAIVWLGLCLLAAAITVVSGRSRWLPRAAVALGLGVALSVHVIGPQAFVAGQDVARALDASLIPPGGRAGLDAAYIGTLGDGAVPVLLDALPKLDPADAATVRNALADRRNELQRQADLEGWPSWNLTRSDALMRLESAQLP